MYQVYILRNECGRSYIGISAEVQRRVEQHNAGVSRWTRGKGPWELTWVSRPMALGEARKLENLFKRQKGGGGVEGLKRMHGP